MNDLEIDQDERKNFELAPDKKLNKKIVNRKVGKEQAANRVMRRLAREGAYRASDDRHYNKVQDHIKALEKQGHKVTGSVTRDDSVRSHETDIYYTHKKTGTEKSKRVATRMSYEDTNLSAIRRVLDEAIHKKGGGKKGRGGSKGQDTEGDDHPINIARKVIDMGRAATFTHKNKERTNMKPEMAHHMLIAYSKHQRPEEKEQMIKQVWDKPSGLHDYLRGILHKPKLKTISLGGSSLVGGIRPIGAKGK